MVIGLHEENKAIYVCCDGITVLFGSVKLSSKSYSLERFLYVMKIRFERNKTSNIIVMYSLFICTFLV